MVSAKSPNYGLPAIGLLISAFAWLPIGLVGPIVLLGEGDLPTAARVSLVAALGAWCWMQSRVGKVLTVAHRDPQAILWQRIGLALLFSGLVALAAAIAAKVVSLLLAAIPLAFVLVLSPVLLLVVVRQSTVQRHLDAAVRGRVAYFGADRGLAQVGVAMVFVHCLSIAIKLPLVVASFVLGLITIHTAFSDPIAGLVMLALTSAIALSCAKSVMALRLGWHATQGGITPEAFSRRLRRYRILSWVTLALVVVVFAMGTEHGWPARLAMCAAVLPLVVVWPAALGRFARRMRRESELAGAFVPDPNRGLVVGGWLLLGGAVFALLGTQLAWIPFANAVAPLAHPSPTAAAIYGLVCGWAAIEAIVQTSRARLAVGLFGLLSLVYLPVAALLVAFGVGTPVQSAASVGGVRMIVSGTFMWLVPAVPNLLLAKIALGGEQ